MINNNNFERWILEKGAKYRFLNWLFFLIILLIIAGMIFLIKQNIWSFQDNSGRYILISTLVLILFITWVQVLLWSSFLFRYLAYCVSWIISGIRNLLNNILIQIVIILGFSGWFWGWRKQILQENDFDFQDILKLGTVLKIFVIAAVFFTLLQLLKAKNRIVICEFENFTGINKLDPIVKGISSLCSNEMGRLSKLFKTYNDMHPNAKDNMGKMDFTLDVQDIGADFEKIISSESNIKIGIVSVPIRELYAFFRKILSRPMLTGGVHLKGDNKFILRAYLKKGNFKGYWQIEFEENENPPNFRSEKLHRLAQRLVCRILTDLSQEFTPRWKAMYQFTEGLRYFRETLLTETKRKFNYIKAKDAFSLAIRDDENFVQCYYNFGYIYEKLGSSEAAEAAYRKALEKKPGYHQCYYQLANIYYNNYLNKRKNGKTGDKCLKERNLLDAQLFCQQAISLCPIESTYWGLLAVIRFYIWWQEEENKGNKKKLLNYKTELNIPDKVLSDSMTGTMLAWRSLCKSIINGGKFPKYKGTALITLRNLAVLKGMNKQWISRWFFGQALFLDTDHNDLHFEAGKYYYRMNEITNANTAFEKVSEDDEEINDPFSFWALYINVNAQLWVQKKGKEKKQEYLKIIKNGYIHFLDAASEIIHNKRQNYDNELIKQNENLIKDALSPTLIKAYPGEVISKIIELLKDSKNIIDINEWKKQRTNDILNDFLKCKQSDSKLSYIFFKWFRAQISIKIAAVILNEVNKDLENSKHFQEKLKKANSELELAIKRLEKCNPNELRVLDLYMHLARINLLLESYEDALNSAREAARLSPYEPEIRKLLGNIYFNMKDYRQAIKELQTCFHLGNPMDIKKNSGWKNLRDPFDIIEKIGKAYNKEGKILRDPAMRKESFTKAADFFKEYHDIIEDKSYEAHAQGYLMYTEPLGKIHFNLAYFYRELLNYDDAISHYQSALEMAKAQNKAFDQFSESPECRFGKILKKELKNETKALILKIMLEMGWVYMEVQSFGEAEKSFKEAECYQDVSPLAKTELTLGLMFSQVERALTIDRNDRLAEIVKNWEEITENSINEKIKKEIEIIEQLTLNDNQKKKRIEDVQEKRPRLMALYYECLGRLYWKQEKMDEAEKEFETSLQFMPNPRVYFYLAEFYLLEASESRIGRKPMLLEKARNACKLCRKNDLRLQYEKELDDLEKNIHDANAIRTTSIPTTG